MLHAGEAMTTARGLDAGQKIADSKPGHNKPRGFEKGLKSP
jgi:hypothetical protein